MKKISLLVITFCMLFAFNCKSNKDVVEEELFMSDTSSDFDFWGTNESTPVLLDPIEISFGEFDKMVDTSKKCQNYKFAKGQEIIIDGEISITFDMAIGQRKDGTFIGTSLVVNGWTQDDFPEDGVRAKVKAKVEQNTEYYFEYLVANPEDIQIID